MIYIIAAILIFGVLIAVHELGHFLAAKACGVRVNEFSIGMGPTILHKTKGDTTYSLRLLHPVGKLKELGHARIFRFRFRVLYLLSAFVNLVVAVVAACLRRG